MGLIVGQVLGQLMATALLIYPIYREDRNTLPSVKLSDLKEEGLRYKNFPIFSLPASLINITANQLPIILLSWFFGMAVVGQFSLTQRVLAIPGALISQSILGVFKERASRDYRETGSCRDIYIKTFKALVKMSVIPFLILFFGSRQLIPFILGQEWVLAGVYAQILTVMLFFRFIVSPLSYVLIVAEKQRVNLLWQTCLLIFTILSMYVGKQANDPLLSITIFSISYSLLYLLMLHISYKYSAK
jgi:O-antigen/teichoic acid export membrane protein